MSVYMECPYMEYQSLAVSISLQKSFFRSIIDMYLTWLNSINKLATRGHHSQKKSNLNPRFKPPGQKLQILKISEF